MEQKFTWGWLSGDPVGGPVGRALIYLGAALLLTAVEVNAATISCAEVLGGGASAEVELRVLTPETLAWSPEADAVLDLLTTVNGRVDGLLNPFALLALPEDLAGALSRTDPGSTGFDDLPPRVRHELIRYQLSRRPVKTSPHIAGLRLRPVVRLRWDQPRVFLGRPYAAGIPHEVNLATIDGAPNVDIGNIASGLSGELLEFHFRSHLHTPAELEREVWTLMEGLGISQRKAHVHVVEPIGRHRFEDEAERFGFVNGYRYFNLAVEMISILHKNASIRSSRPTAWAALHGRKLAGLIDWLEHYAEVGGQPAVNEFKMSYVGMHFPLKYDGADRFGLHFRSVDKAVSAEMGELLDLGRAFLRRDSWVHPRDLAWLEANHRTYPLSFLVASLWHRESPQRPDSEGAPAVIRDQLMADEDLRDLIEEAGVEQYEAQMLTYDWAADPLYFGDVAGIQRVRECQQRAFARFAEARAYRLEFTQDFLRCAGLYEHVRSRLWSGARQPDAGPLKIGPTSVGGPRAYQLHRRQVFSSPP